MSDYDKSEQSSEDIRILTSHVNSLMEHFDTVEILVTRNAEAKLSGTVYLNRGAGNWFARYGQMREWVTCEEEHMREGMRKKDA